jgi:hypothetical protein
MADRGFVRLDRVERLAGLSIVYPDISYVL